MSDSKPQNDPSMDDILASIRKIISDDEARAATGPGTPANAPPPRPVAAQPPRPMPAAAPGNDDVLLLTELVEEPPLSPMRPGPRPVEPRPAARPVDEPQPQPTMTPIPSPLKSGVMDLNEPQPMVESSPPASVEPPASRPLAAAPPSLVVPPQSPGSAMSESAPPPPPASRDPVSKVSAAFDRLNRAVGDTDPAASAPAPSAGGASDKTIEDLVREMLKPMLREWMDRHLPDLVEKTTDDLVREMLKPLLREWMDRNLPEMVEKLVEREIARLTRR